MNHNDFVQGPLHRALESIMSLPGNRPLFCLLPAEQDILADPQSLTSVDIPNHWNEDSTHVHLRIHAMDHVPADAFIVATDAFGHLWLDEFSLRTGALRSRVMLTLRPYQLLLKADGMAQARTPTTPPATFHEPRDY